MKTFQRILVFIAGFLLAGTSLRAGFTTPPPSTAAPGTVVTIAGNASAVNPPNNGFSLLVLWWQTPNGTWANQVLGSGASGTINGSTSSFTFTAASGSSTGTWNFAIGAVMNSAPAQGTAPTGGPATANTAVSIPITGATIASLTYNGASQSPPSTPSSITPAGATATVSATPQSNAGTYSATVTGTGSYSGTLSVPWTINQVGQTISLSASATVIPTGGTITYTASGAATGVYNWSVSPAGPTGISGTGASQTITFPSTGTFTVSVISPNSTNYSASNSPTSVVTVDQLPAVSGGFSPTSISFGQSSTFTFSAAQGSTPLTGISCMYWAGTGTFWVTIPGTNYNLTTWPTSYPNDSTYFIYSSSTFADETASGSSSTKSFVVTPKFSGASNGFGVFAWDSSWAGMASMSSGGLTINRTTPTATFANATKPPQSGSTFTAAAGDLNATFVNPYSSAVAAPSGAIAYTIATGSPNGTPGSSVGIGTTFTAGLIYVIHANYPGYPSDPNYNTAGADSTWTISKVNQTITFANPGSQAAAVPLTLSATASSGLPVSFTLNSGPATLAGNTLTFTGTGTVSVTAKQAGNTSWNAAADVPQSFQVVSSSQTITFPTIPTKVFGDLPFTISATASSGLAVTFSIVSGPATIAGSTVTITGANTVSVKATQVGNAQYASANSIQSFNVDKATPVCAFASRTLTLAAGYPTYILTSSDLNAVWSHPTNGSVGQPTGSVTYLIVTGSPSGTVGSTPAVGTALPLGVYWLQSVYHASANYNAANSATAIFTVRLPASIGSQLHLFNPSSPGQSDTSNTTGLKVNRPQN